MYIKKDKKTAGADERTPSRSQYFSWVNSTNEGSTEAQTLANLDYFDYMKRTYGMEVEIYAWDAGNLDGSSGTYETLDSPKLKAQYPNGYAPVAKRAAELGMRLGVWGGPSGYGNTEESAAKRKELLVSLCRDYNFALFKFDAVCGGLEPHNEKHFVDTMTECRKYSPDLILLNHRLELGRGMPHATTFLWEGIETYVDVHSANHTTAPHHRAFIMDRGNTPDLVRLTEDHGVCLSSFNDYFEDDLIIQAFGRNLILAPEIYANPWFLRDFEQAHLARIYNLHRRYRHILIDGMTMPEGEFFPKNTVVRGNGERRFIITGNMTWEEKMMIVRLDRSIGLSPCEKVSVIIHHPYEEFFGQYNYGDEVKIPVKCFRASLVEVCSSEIADNMLTGCQYEVIHEDKNGRADKVKILSSKGEIKYTDGTPVITTQSFDNTLFTPKHLASTNEFSTVAENAGKQLETALFAQNHDSYEKIAVDHAGQSCIPEVRKAREAFFNQATYKVRGCENGAMFDGKDETFFDATSKLFYLADGFREDGGCLRVDLGDVYSCDEIRFEYFDPDCDMPDIARYVPSSIKKQVIPPVCDYSTDLGSWKKTTLETIETVKKETKDILVQNIHSIVKIEGRRRAVTYPVDKDIRYFRMPKPLDHIHKISIVKDGIELPLRAPHANNMLSYNKKVEYCKEAHLTVSSSDFKEGCYIAACLDGYHGVEGAFAVLEIDGEYVAPFDRAPAYRCNPWECYPIQVMGCDKCYSYYFRVTKDMCDKELTLRILGVNGEMKDYPVNVYLCDDNRETSGIEISL